MMRNYIKMTIRTILVALICLLLSLVNDIFIRTKFPEYSQILRYLDHFTAGIGLTILIYCFFRILYDFLFWKAVKGIIGVKLREALHSDILLLLISCILSIYAEFFWEYYQYKQRGYLQYDQLLVYFIGISAFFIAFNIFRHLFVNKSTMNRNVID